MKILHVIDYFSPALGYQETYLAAEQQKAGHDVTVLSSDRYFPFPNYAETVQSMLGERRVGTGRKVEKGINVIRLPIAFECFTRVWLRNLERVVIFLQPDVIHVHSTSSITAVRVALLKKRMPQTVQLFDDHSHYSVILSHPAKKVFYWVFQMFFSRILNKYVDVFVGITDEAKTIMKEYVGIKKGIRVLPLGADIKTFAFSAKMRKAFRRKFKVPETDVIFIYAGKIIPSKGVHVLVEAITQLKQRNFSLFLIGNGEKEYVQQLKSILKKWKLQNKVVWVPLVQPEELYKWYSFADLGIWPMQESISMIEAAACELPILIKDSPDMKRRISRGNGFTYQEGNVQQLTALLDSFAKKGKKARAIGKKGRALVADNWSWGKISSEFLKLYTQGRAL